MSLIFIFIGLAAGLLSGMLGLGGGIFLVPSFAAIFITLGLESELAFRCGVGTSLATMTFTALFAILSHIKYTRIDFWLIAYLLLGSVIGAMMGAWVADSMPVYSIKFAFTMLCLYVALRLFYGRLHNKHRSPEHVSVWLFPVVGFCVGGVSAMLGIGGGLILVPLLVWFGFSFAKASATSIVCTLPTVMVGALGQMIVGLDTLVPLNAVGFIVWDVALLAGFGALLGAPLGVKCLHYFPEWVVRRVFAGILVIIAWQMFPGLLT